MKAIICDKCHRIEKGVNHSQIMKRLRPLGWVRGDAAGSYLCPVCSGLPAPRPVCDKRERKAAALRRAAVIKVCCIVNDVLLHARDIPEFNRGRVPGQLDRVWKNNAHVLEFCEVRDVKKDVSNALLTGYMAVADAVNLILKPVEDAGLSAAASDLAVINAACWLLEQLRFQSPELQKQRCIALLQQTLETLERYMVDSMRRTAVDSPAHRQADEGEELGVDIFLHVEPLFALA